MKITIPTVEELSDRLGGLDRLLTAKRWERAAIVYAFTVNEGPGGSQGRDSDLGFPMPAKAFARLGFSGLAHHETVARYRNAWQRAVDEGHAAPTEPGQEITLPDLDWPPYFDSTAGDDRYEALARKDQLRAQAEEDGVGASKVLDVAKNRAALAAAIKADPAVMQAARDALRAADRNHQARQEGYFAEHGERYDDQRRRDEKRKTEDPLLRGLEQQQAVRDLGSALMHTRRDTHQRADEIADALRRMGDVGQDAWRPGLLTSLPEDLRHAEEGIAALLAQVEQVKRHRDTGMTDLDAGLTELLGGGEQS